MSPRSIGILLFLLTPSVAAAQDEPLGQPAGWSAEEAVSLIDIAEGSQLMLEPDPTTLVLAILPEARLPLVETRDRWVKVRYGDRVGWVDLDAHRKPALAPARAIQPEPEPLDLGMRNWLRDNLGPYQLFSLVDEPALVDYLGHVAAEHGRVYAERYGLEVHPELTGSVVLFAGRQEFFEFQRARGHDFTESRVDGYFHSPDTVLMYRGFFSRQQLAATLIHELTHLVSWQALRRWGQIDTMPPWLDEGMAEDLSLSRVDRKQRLVAAPLGPTNLHYERRLGVIVFELERKIATLGTAPSLPQLLAMDREAFLASDSQLNYLMSAMWVRYLLSDGDSQLAEGFRAYLKSVAAGGKTEPEELRSRLGLTWPQLTGGFRGWLVMQRARFGL